MANVTIPNLTSATTIAPSTDLMVLEQTEGTRKATLSQIFTSSATSGSGLGITSGGVYTIKSGLDSDISDINTLLGNTSIASIGDGTVTGAISTLNSDLTETVLWENPNATSVGISASTVTLADDISNFKYLRFYYDFSSAQPGFMDVGVSNVCLTYVRTDAHVDRRQITCSSTSATISDNYRFDFSGAYVTDNTHNVLTKICGVKL